MTEAEARALLTREIVLQGGWAPSLPDDAITHSGRDAVHLAENRADLRGSIAALREQDGTKFLTASEFDKNFRPGKPESENFGRLYRAVLKRQDQERDLQRITERAKSGGSGRTSLRPF